MPATAESMALFMEYTETLKLGENKEVFWQADTRGAAHVVSPGRELRQRRVTDLWAILRVRSIKNVMGHQECDGTLPLWSTASGRLPDNKIGLYGGVCSWNHDE